MLTRRSLLKALALLPFCPQSIKSLAAEPVGIMKPYIIQGVPKQWMGIAIVGRDHANLLDEYCLRVVEADTPTWSESIPLVKEDDAT